MQMHDEISHLRIVDRLACLCLPRSVGLGIIWIDADDIETAEILELDTIEILSSPPKTRCKSCLFSPTAVIALSPYSIGLGPRAIKAA